MLTPAEKATTSWRTAGANDARTADLPVSGREIVGVVRGSIPRTRGSLRRPPEPLADEARVRSRADHPANGDRARPAVLCEDDHEQRL